jgi:two-component SAPR family response regulator
VITVVLVDDMRPALRELEFLLGKYPEFSITGMYTDPLTAIEKIVEQKPQVVFLDINMPQLQGIDAASRILDLSPDTEIVFVTAYDRYAVEAFEVHAMDYLLKPVSPDRLKKTAERLIKRKSLVRESNNRKLQIQCLGSFQVAWEGEEPIKWRAEKTRELFAFLLHKQGRNISREEILDKLWPEDEPEKAIRQLYNGIYHIRKVLEQYRIDRSLIKIDSSYHLKLGSVFYDVGRLYELGKSTPADSLETLEEMESLYTGEYLQDKDYPWALFERESLEKLFQQCLLKLSQQYIEKKQFVKAENALLKAYRKNPYEEIITELLLRLYAETGEKSKAVRHFNAYATLLAEDLGIKPDGKLYDLYRLAK